MSKNRTYNLHSSNSLSKTITNQSYILLHSTYAGALQNKMTIIFWSILPPLVDV